MHEKIRVLILPVTTEIGLEVLESFKYKHWISCIGASSDSGLLQSLVCKEWVYLPDISDINFIENVNKIIDLYSIDIIYPAHDEIIYFFSKNYHLIKTKILISDSDVCEITRYKSKTYKLLQGLNGIRVPEVFSDFNQVNQYPIFIKPDRGQGGVNAEIIWTKQALFAKNIDLKSTLICEYLPGTEYTVECFTSGSKGLIYCRGRERLKIRNGIAVSSKFVDDDEFFEIAVAIQRKLKIRGGWFFQLKRNTTKNLVLLEVAPRIPGSSGLSRVSGVNLPLLSLYDHFNIPVEITSEKINIAIERTLINRYSHNIIYNKVYIDFDDTLIINGEINTLAVKFLFQCINNHVKIILITRCKGNLMALLDKFRLRNIFDEIIHIKNGEPKSKFIDKSGGVFIDDSYQERKEVLTSIKNIYTLDSSMLSMLIKHSEV